MFDKGLEVISAVCQSGPAVLECSQLAASQLPVVQVDLAKESAFKRPPKWNG
jgi:hypothetical protein